ncbi:CDP-glycerol glycerophosphotransferase family protein [Mammaliicoccus sciuri]|uniref:CDP-glycerol glycerophosphotransferase family protein n=2 Tax=Mammaliicoccus sciuri TaxID=1296 RepID=UPI002DBA09A2|nr:CDP-glycerol glycerophosphotransferase family protein [Mammaliicoccus sciuri]MEB6231489.1 CDP-glycerol glycerophosphotransferase family protein [Mammaliicoccus sciuri]
MNKKLLSIIVPVYNVQGYIHDCVDSLLAQNIDNSLYEIILINDGSKDKSGEIIDRFSKTHENIKSFHFNNSGLGATRNKGINIANGKYIAFLDSDDFVPKKAYESLLESAEFNDADIVTSPVERFEDGKYTRSGLHKKIDFTQKIGTTLEESSSLLYDTTSTNKLYNLEFLKENNLLFPENIVYEDIYFTMAAYVKANKINIIEDVTYIWRIRSGESISISQDRFNIQGYKDRLKTCFDTLSYLKENANSIIAREFEKRIVEFHIPLFFPEYNNADLIYTKEFSDITNEYLQHLDQSFILDCDYRKQTIYNAIKKSNYDLILNYSLDKVKTMKLTLDGSIIANDDYLNDDYLNKINFNKSDILKTKVIEVKAKDNNIIINALITSTLLNAIDSNFIKASLVNDKKEQEIKIYKEIDNSYNLIIPTSHIDNYSNFGHTKVKLTYSKDGLCTEKILSEPGNDKFKTTLLIKNRNYNYRVNFNFGWELLIEKQEINTIFERVQIIEQKLYIYAENIDPNAIFKLKNYREQSIVGVVENNTIIFDLRKIPKDNRLFELKILKDGLHTYNYKFKKMPKFFNFINNEDKYEYVLRVYSNHSISVNKKGRHSQLKSIQNKNGKLIINYISPYLDNDISSNLVLKSTNGKVTKHFISKRIKENQFECTIDLETNNINHFLTYGNFIFSVDYFNDFDLYPESLLLNEKKYVSFPFEFSYSNRRYNFISKNGHLIYMNKTQILPKFEDTKQKRDKIYKYLYPVFRMLPIRSNYIVYYSYWGDQYSCSPKAIYKNILENEKKFKNIWILNDTNMPIDGNGIKVKKNSLKYWYYLATAKYFIQNTNMPIDYKKRKKQKEVQTFHGTFMKTMGFDTPELKYETRQNKIDEFQKKVNNWNYVSIPSDYMKEKAKSAFNTTVKALKTGFPRNDMLFDALKYKEETKSSLNIPKGKKVILYAPTWREGKSSNIEMNIKKIQETLDDQYVLLIRAHYMVSGNMDIRDYYPFAINVSNYPSIEELYSITDVLITDYSSVMFDFAYLKKPMIFYAYDLEKYLYGERGVYLNYSNIIPGPLVRTTDEIINVLSNYSNLDNEYKDKYEKFYNVFCQYGRNGNSSNQVVNELIE